MNVRSHLSAGVSGVLAACVLRTSLARVVTSLCIGVVTGLVAACAAPSAHAQGSKSLAITKIGPGTYLHAGQQQVWHPDNAGDIANLGFIVGDRCVAVIDTGSTLALAKRFKAAIAEVTDKPICFVINSHAHPDHLLGNAAFKSSETKFVGHKNLAAAVATRGPIYLRAALRDLGPQAEGTELVAPDMAVVDEIELDLGGRLLQVRAWPTAHTDADVTVFDPQAKILWLGDLAFVGHLPVVDGNLKAWLTIIDQLGQLPANSAVPGHGAFDVTGWPGLLKAQKAYLTALRDDVRKALAQGQTLAQTVESVTSGADQHWLVYNEFHKRNISAAYAELEWE